MTNAEFETFKDNVKHYIKGDQCDFLYKILSEDTIDKYIEENNYLCALYLLSMVDYISRLNNIPLCNKYEHLRKFRYENPVYPLSIILDSRLKNLSEEQVLEEMIKRDPKNQPIREFARHNIIEGDVFNAV